MGSKRGKAAFWLLVCLLLAISLGGCRPSEKKVRSSSYYKDLQKKYKKLKKENKKLSEELSSKDQPTEDEQRAVDYLAKIGRDRIISIEVGYADHMEGGELIRNKDVFPSGTAIAKRADLTSKYTPDQIEKKFGPGYKYILYDEDNAIYEILVYDGDYVVFTDLPNNVYHSFRASALGDAFLHYRDGYPNSKLLHRLADSSLVTFDGKCYENDSAVGAANCIRQMDRKNSSRKKAEKLWREEQKKDKTKGDAKPEGEEYIFYHHGNTMRMTLYDRFICITNMDGKETWYQVDPDEIRDLKKTFLLPEDETDASSADGEGNGDKRPKTHDKEIEEESNVTGQE